MGKQDGGSPPAGIRFGRYELDTLRMELRCDGALLDIEPKPLAVLEVLARATGELVSKVQLMEAVWGDRILTDHVLTRCINRLRAALDDEQGSLIINVYGRGYRFTAPVVLHAVPPLVRKMLHEPKEGDPVPARPHWNLERALDRGAGVWLGLHSKTRETRVFKFALKPQDVAGLRREAAVYRLLQAKLGPSADFSRLLEYNVDSPPYALELEWTPSGSLTDWAHGRGGLAQVPLDERLALLASAAESLARSHGAGVLHLDIKPANMLVYHDAQGHPLIRWTDFGSGRFLDSRALEDFGITQLVTRTAPAAQSGTLLYLAPEVIAGEAATVLSDVYSLGVVLYQMVCGDFRRPLTAGWERDIGDPLLLEDIGSAANGDPVRRMASALELARRLRALPERRTQALLVAEQTRKSALLTRQLEAVRARRPWVMALTAVLVLSLVGSLWFIRQIESARDRAKLEADNAVRVSLFYANQILGATSVFNPEVSGETTVRQAIDRAAQRIEKEALPPLAEAQVRAILSRLYLQQSKTPAALRENRRALDLYSTALGENDPSTIGELSVQAEILLFDDQFAAALDVLDRLDQHGASRSDLNSELPLATAAMRGAVYYALGQFSQALPPYRRALDLYRQLHPDLQAPLAARLEMLALTLAHLGRIEESEALARSALEAANREDGPGRAGAIALANQTLGELAYLEGRSQPARAILESAVTGLGASLGKDAPDTLHAQLLLAAVLVQTGDSARALRLANQARTILTERHGAMHVDVANATVVIGAALLANGQPAAAAAALRLAQQTLARLEGAGAPDAAVASYHLARALAAQDRTVTSNERPNISAAALALAIPGYAWPGVR